MEPSGRNRRQMGRARKPLKQTDRHLVATHGNGSGAHGKEGVNGSSPLEGFRKFLQLGVVCGESRAASGDHRHQLRLAASCRR